MSTRRNPADRAVSKIIKAENGKSTSVPTSTYAQLSTPSKSSHMSALTSPKSTKQVLNHVKSGHSNSYAASFSHAGGSQVGRVESVSRSAHHVKQQQISDSESEPVSEAELSEIDSGYEEDGYEEDGYEEDEDMAMGMEFDEDAEEDLEVDEDDEDFEGFSGMEEDEEEDGDADDTEPEPTPQHSHSKLHSKASSIANSDKDTRTMQTQVTNEPKEDVEAKNQTPAATLSSLLNVDMKKPSVAWNSAPYNPKATFELLGIKDWLCKVLARMAIVRPTEIQQRTIPCIFQGHDVVARAKTGSGKTACFALPIIQQLSADPYGVFALVLTPSRELAFQIAEQFSVFGHSMNIHTCVVIGGMEIVIQCKELATRPHIIVATPGRLADLITRHSAEIHTKHLKYLVLDEADRLLESTFTEDLQTILDVIPGVEQRQTLLFSATITRAMIRLNNDPSEQKQGNEDNGDGEDEEDDIVRSSTHDGGHDMRETSDKQKGAKQIKLLTHNAPVLSNKLEAQLFKDPLWIQASTTEDPIVDTLDQYYLFIPQAVKEAYLAYLLRVCNPNDPDYDRTKSFIIFTATCDGCEFLSQVLLVLKIPNVSLHSKLTQNRRTASLHKFKAGVSKILVATDAASRGLDIPSVTTVINYDVPRFVADYVHRVGRTARAGRGGQAITFVSQYEIDLFKAVEKTIRKTLDAFQVPENKVLERLRAANEAKKKARIRLLDFAISDGRLDEVQADKKKQESKKEVVLGQKRKYK